MTTRKITVKSRAHRALRQLSRFTFQQSALGGFTNVLRLGRQEEFVGLYRNPENSPGPDLAISSLGVYLVGRETTEAVAFSEILSLTSPPEKTSADNLVLKLRGGQTVTVPILGGHGRFRDVFAVQRFLDRVIADIRGEREP